jgi:NAD(P)-dependent dehydrogenase (short-subunit alcohol dehydrogenase family)
MQVLVTGATGGVGRGVVEGLLAEGASVRNQLSFCQARREIVPAAPSQPRSRSGLQGTVAR